MRKDIAALILAGGKTKPEMQAACGGIENRALVHLNGRPMLDYVVDAVRAGVPNGRLLIAGDVPAPQGFTAVAGGVSMIDTLMNGAAALSESQRRLLVVTADVPFLTGKAVADFVTRADALGPDVPFVYPIIEAEKCRERFPDMKRTTLRVAEGEFTGGNLSLLDPAFLRDNEPLLRNAYARRKSVSGLARLLGPTLPLRLLASRLVPSLLSIKHLEAAVGRALGRVSARAVITPYPEIGADVDRPDDVAIAQRILASSSSTD